MNNRRVKELIKNGESTFVPQYKIRLFWLECFSLWFDYKEWKCLDHKSVVVFRSLKIARSFLLKKRLEEAKAIIKYHCEIDESKSEPKIRKNN